MLLQPGGKALKGKTTSCDISIAFVLPEGDQDCGGAKLFDS